jgi:hypothetical protein
LHIPICVITTKENYSLCTRVTTLQISSLKVQGTQFKTLRSNFTVLSSSLLYLLSTLSSKLKFNSVTCNNHFKLHFHSRTVYLDIIKFFTPTDAHVFKRSIKTYIKTAPACFGVFTTIRERTI